MFAKEPPVSMEVAKGDVAVTIQEEGVPPRVFRHQWLYPDGPKGADEIQHFAPYPEDMPAGYTLGIEWAADDKGRRGLRIGLRPASATTVAASATTVATPDPEAVKLSRMPRADLVTKCAELGIVVNDAMGTKKLAALIVEKQAK